jgi:hypothetical protein
MSTVVTSVSDVGDTFEFLSSTIGDRNAIICPYVDYRL